MSLLVDFLGKKSIPAGTNDVTHKKRKGANSDERDKRRKERVSGDLILYEHHNVDNVQEHHCDRDSDEPLEFRPHESEDQSTEKYKGAKHDHVKNSDGKHLISLSL